ncbi:hypothetical protein [Nocardia niigatensis]|uniref:hypothetical protein n=1 Tax=Nocardia niigatensis TaxID=209249 RepID=UPI0012F6590E|nr:hypothetical protein [Nocardia niigatensis]
MTEIGAFERKSAAGWAQPERAILAYRAIVAALVAGVAETLGHATLALYDPGTRASGLAAGLAVRAAIYLTVFALAARMLFGSRWARGMLVLGLGTVGLASLVVEPVGAILSAGDLGALCTGWTPKTVVFGVFRAVHIVAVLVAVPAAVLAGQRVDQAVGGGSSPARTSSTVVTGRSQTEPRQM